VQYTGLKDKNGKEIYEGDILKSDIFTGQVIYYAPTFMVVEKDGWDMITNGEDYEIVGNIYENPELLKEASDEYMA
jgi:hypothetical protein